MNNNIDAIMNVGVDKYETLNNLVFALTNKDL